MILNYTLRFRITFQNLRYLKILMFKLGPKNNGIVNVIVSRI